MPLPIGTLLNRRYRITSILGQGGMGAVYRATDESLGVSVAVKENLFLTDEYSRQFQREAHILAGLRHPGLPHVSDYFALENQGQYLVMDFIEGEDLRQRMERTGILSERDVILVGVSVCEALTYLHTRNPAVVHRDLKPGNIKITPEGRAVLVDFGLAKVMIEDQATMTGARAMTPGYSPPEQYGTSRTDVRSDIYALGATLYAALTGSIPEDGLARMTGKAALTDIRELRSKLSRKLADVIEQALEIDSEDRFQSAEEMRQALIACSDMETLLKDRPTLAPPPPEVLDPLYESGREVDSNRRSRPLASLQRLSRRRRNNLWTMASIAIFLIAFIGLILLLRPDLPGQAVAFFQPTATPTQEIEEPTATIAAVIDAGTATPSNPNKTQAPATETLPPTITPTETPQPTPTLMGGGQSEIAFSSNRTGTYQIWIISAEGKNPRQVTSVKDGACQPAWSPDGGRIVFTSPCVGKRDQYPGSSLWIINADGSNLTPLPASPEGDYDPAWSPDGGKVAFTSLRSGRPSVWVIDLNSQMVVNISQAQFADKQPAWSPISKQISFIRQIVFGQVWIMSEAGDQQGLFSQSGEVENLHPTWSQDGSVIFYSQLIGGSAVPRLVGQRYEDRNSPREFRIPADPNIDIGPVDDVTVSPDNFWLAYESWPDGSNHDIYVMTTNGANRTRLTTDPGFDFCPAWRPVSNP